MKTLSLPELKSMMQLKSQKELLSFSLLPHGLPRGTITEISGYGKTEATAHFIAEHPDLRIAWIEETFSAFPVAFLQRHVKLNKILFIEAHADLDWSILQTLKSQAFPIIVFYCREIGLRSLRRIQLATERAHSATIWLTPQPQNLYPVGLHLQSIRRGSHLELQVLKKKYL